MSQCPLVLQSYGSFFFAGEKEESVFLSPIGRKKGVYLWTIPFGGKYLVYYVGKTDVSFADRLLQHVQSYLNGYYRLYDPIEFAQGRK